MKRRSISEGTNKRKASESGKSKAEVTTPRASAKASDTFPIVGIGASAGGLEALREFLGHLPEKTGMAFAVVQHLDPTHGSLLQEILSRSTKIPVSEVTDGVKVEPDHLYVIPANTNMIISDGVLRLRARTLTRGQHMPVDQFLTSLAQERDNRAIGVILSGTASDGTEGCRAIKAAGGITFAQTEDSAKYPSMPHSAIAAGCVDFVLDTKGIAKELTRIGRHPYVVSPSAQKKDAAVIASGSDLEKLLTRLRGVTGVDFGLYKQTTLQRRIKRRMVLHHLDNIKGYLRYVESNAGELDELYRDILIHVTGFFRDKDAFDALRKEVFPNLIRSRKLEETPIRVWVPGCSTGEEVYSIAICLLEYLWESARKEAWGVIANKALQIFATDISEDALDRARSGLYTEAAVADVSSARLSRFFVKIDGGYQINKSIRDMCIFARQDVTRDPPFSNLDLISCRNLLIYLGPVLQKRVIPTFHYALKPNGYLLLGGSESLGAFSDHFNLIEKKHKIYQKKESAARLVTFFTTGEHFAQHLESPKQPQARASALTMDKEVERILLSRFAPASIIVNSDMEIVQFRGRTGAYLEPASGQPTFSLSKMAREGLLVDLRAAINKAKKENAAVRTEGVHIRSNGGTKEVNLEVMPVQQAGSSERFYLVVFEKAEPQRVTAKQEGKRATAPSAVMSRDIERLRRELAQMREQFQSLIEDHETTVEEYRSANEEVLSANEELQSTNEELETAKEELQSTNEELVTLNETMQNRNAELAKLTDDLNNVLEGAR
ncbi:MAG TPA: chemotaxis protein CheB, partial [Terriglobales bacterium]|nr:chemotaxis protein CheB [Terriglobales bacterium]